MIRVHWAEAELEDLSLPWPVFTQLHPNRSYDSYEVKRRRVAGGSAGTNKRSIAAHRSRLAKAERALRVLAGYLGVDVG